MEEFLIKLQNISKQSDKLILEKNIIEKRILNIQENISKYEEMKLKYTEEVAHKKNQLMQNKNKHLIKCQKMEELNGKLNDILIRKQNIDDEENKIASLKQMDIINKTLHLLKNIQKLSDSLETSREHYILVTEQIKNNNFNNRKTMNIINSFLKKNIINTQHEKEKGTDRKTYTDTEIETEAEKEETDEKKKNKDENTKTDLITDENKTLKIIPTKEINNNLINFFSQNHTNLTIEKQQFLFVFMMNILNKIQTIHLQMERKKDEVENEEKNEEENTKTKDENEILKQNEKYNHMIHQFLYKNYIAI